MQDIQEHQKEIEKKNPYKKRVESDPLKDVFSLQEQQLESKRRLQRKQYLQTRKFLDYKYYIELEDIIDSPLFTASLKKGSLIYSVPEGEKYRLPKDVYVKAYSLSDSEHYLYLINNKGVIKFRAPRSSLEKIERISNLDVPPTLYQEVPPKEKPLIKYDRKLRLKNLLQVHLDYISSNFTSDVLSNAQAQTGTGFRTSFATLYQFETPFELGLKAEFEKSNFDTATRDTFLLGPSIKWRSFKIGKDSFHLSTSFLNALSSRLSSEDQSIRLQAGVLDISLSYASPNSWGKFIWGISARRYWQKVKSTKNQLALTDPNSVDNSIGGFIGQEF